MERTTENNAITTGETVSMMTWRKICNVLFGAVAAYETKVSHLFWEADTTGGMSDTICQFTGYQMPCI